MKEVGSKEREVKEVGSKEREVKEGRKQRKCVTKWEVKEVKE